MAAEQDQTIFLSSTVLAREMQVTRTRADATSRVGGSRLENEGGIELQRRKRVGLFASPLSPIPLGFLAAVGE
jgi:hypothetical protein